jgi:deazaflavin-dependent oxidoreductase (nitroreductase family)
VQTQQLPSWLPTANRIVRAVHRIGLPLGTVHLLTVPGRRTGRPRTTPVSPLVVDGHRYIVAALPQSDWARNARAAGHGELVRGRRRWDVALPEVTDPDLRRAVMRAFPTEVPHGVDFFVRLGLVERADAEQFAAAAERVAVFELCDAPGDTPARP